MTENSKSFHLPTFASRICYFFFSVYVSGSDLLCIPPSLLSRKRLVFVVVEENGPVLPSLLARIRLSFFSLICLEYVFLKRWMDSFITKGMGVRFVVVDSLTKKVFEHLCDGLWLWLRVVWLVWTVNIVEIWWFEQSWRLVMICKGWVMIFETVSVGFFW